MQLSPKTFGENFLFYPDNLPQKKVYIRTQTQTKINLVLDSEFNSMHFGIEINKRLKLLTPISFCV